MSAGTPMAAAATVPPDLVSRSAACDAVWRDHRNQFFLEEARKTTRLTIGLGIIVQLVVMGLFIHADYPAWRIGGMAILYVMFAAAHKVIIRPIREAGRIEAAFIYMGIIAQLMVVGSATLCGGIFSPYLPGLVLPSIVSLLFFGPYPVARWTALANGLMILGMAVLPRSVIGDPLPSDHYTIIAVIGIFWNLFMLHLMVGKLTAMSNRAGDSMAFLREERVTEAIAQLRRLQSVGAKVAHELKNPLASIKGLCQLVARTPESERTQERLAVVASEISRMETILHEYLSFSRPLEDLKAETIDLNALARDVLDVLAGRADQAGVTLELEGMPCPVQGDPRRLKEALINLVSNAIEATPTGGKVALRLRVNPAGATLEVRDTGRGISAEDLERLGTSFFTTRPNGTGLGVVLAQGVITQHGGTLDYKSTVGHGTTATIHFPSPSSTPPSPATVAEPAPRAAMVEARA